jgi:hypothetical protein
MQSEVGGNVNGTIQACSMVPEAQKKIRDWFNP